MIAQLTGTLIDKGLDEVVLDVAGVGYLVHISLTTLQALPAVGQAVKLLTYLQVREDALTLYGFATAEERRAFELCLSVTGIGPKLALAALSGLGATALGDAIAAQDVGRLTRIPGIGKKTAERLVMELRDKFKPSKTIGGSAKAATNSRGAAASADVGVFGDVTKALCNLGYKPADADRAVAKALEELGENSPVEAVLRWALRFLQRD